MSEVSSQADTLPATAHDRDATGDEPPDPLVGSMIGSYRVEGLLGQGGMGSVYRAVHPRIGTEVAIKVLHASLARSSTVTERFEREARASGAIGSPYIPKFYDFGVLPDGCTYAVLDYYDGESVADRIERGPIDLPLVKTLLMQATRALGDAHRQGIIHRDVKPDNLFIVRDGDEESVRVLDFGIAKVTHDRDLTHAGVFLGTPHYCAPEQLRAKEPAPTMDVYALGSTAFEMLTGEAPFADGDLHTLIRRKTEGEEPDTAPLAAFPSEVRDTIVRALAFDPDDRFADMAQLEAALAQWPTGTSRPRRKWPLAAAALVVGVAVAATAFLLATETPEPIEVVSPPIAPREPEPTPTEPEPTLTEPEPEPEPEAAEMQPRVIPRMTMRPQRMDDSMSTMMAADWVDWESQ